MSQNADLAALISDDWTGKKVVQEKVQAEWEVKRTFDVLSGQMLVNNVGNIRLCIIEV